jgi:hypothetical protein
MFIANVVSCAHAHEMHHARHKDILKIMRKLAEIDDDIAGFLAEKITLHMSNIRSNAQGLQVAQTAGAGDVLESTETLPILRRAKRKKAKKMGGLDTPNKRWDVEAFSRHDTDFISQAIHLVVHEGKGAWKGGNIYDIISRENQSRQNDDEDIESLAETFAELTLKSATPNSKQKKNTKMLSAVTKASYIHGSAKKYSPKGSPKIDPYDGLDPQIFTRLGIKALDLPKSSSTRKDFMRKLIAHVKEDLVIQAQEIAEAKMREDGFWKWAGRGAYHLIMKNRESMDWATGVRRSEPNDKASSQNLLPHLPEGPRYELENDNEIEEDMLHDRTMGDNTTLEKPLIDNTPFDHTSLGKTEGITTVHEPNTKIQDKITMANDTATRST